MTSRHFVLLHGACNGAWIWYKVSALLKEAGHKVTAIDLASSGIHPKKWEEVNSFLEYSEPLLTFMESLPSDGEKVVIVAHSLGGYSASIAMERFPEKVSLCVFVTASMLGPDFTYELVAEKFKELSAPMMDTVFTYGNGRDKTPTVAMVGPKYMEFINYRKCPREDLELGLLLVRPTPVFDQEQAAIDTRVTKEKYGSIPRVFVVCDGEQKGAFQMWQVENNPPNEHILIEDSDHMIMLSRPGPLVDYILKVAAKYL
ncbi:Methyl jasmonate esterase 1 [Linum grandiflorum]